MRKILIIKGFAAIAFILTMTGAVAQDVIVKGLRVPQLTTTQRAGIGAEASPNIAKGQQVFNLTTGKMEYWDGTRWVAVGDVKAGGKNGIVVTGSGTDSIGVELPAGDVTNKVLVWDNTDQRWEPSTISAVITETTTTLTDNNDGTFTYVNELGSGSEVTFDVSKLIHDSIAANPETVTTLTYNNGTLTYTNENNVPSVANISALIHDSIAAQVDNNTTYTAGTGLILAGNEFSLDQDVVAAQIHDSISSIDFPEDTNTEYSEGFGIVFTEDTVINTNPVAIADSIAKVFSTTILEDTIQARIAAMCVVDEKGIERAHGIDGIIVDGSGTDSITISLNPSVIAAQIHDSIAAQADENTTYNASNSVILNAGAFERAELTGGDVTAPQNSNVLTIANNAVTTAKIADKNVTLGKLADGSTNGQIMQWNGSAWVLATLPADQNTTYDGDNSTIVNNSNVFSVKDDGITTTQIADGTVAWNDLNTTLQNTIAKDTIVGNELTDTIPNRGGLTKTGTGTSADPYKIGLIEGTKVGDMLAWDGSRWKLLDPDDVQYIKQLYVEIDSIVTVESEVYYGSITCSGSTFRIVSVVPIISSTVGYDFVPENITISTSIRRNGNTNEVFWKLRIKNDNIDVSKSALVEGVNINYTSAGDSEFTSDSWVGKVFIGQ